MSPLALSFIDGTTFFIGLVLVLVAEGLLFRFRNCIARPILTALAIIGIVLVIISATPLPIWAYAIWIIPAVVGLLSGNRTSSQRRLLVVIYSVLFASTVGLCTAEARHHYCPKITIPKGSSVYVLGDSISAGIGTKDRCWPTVLADLTRLHVVNLAQPGATLASAGDQAKGIDEPHSLIIIEIGGNDLLGGKNVRAFRDTLDSLVCSLRANQHQVLLLELPLFPFQNSYGKAQRDVVAKHRVALLPKRCFARVLGTENGTLDGLHLSQAGHDAMAQIIADIIKMR